MKFFQNMSGSDKWFFYSIPFYIVIGVLNIIFKWTDLDYIVLGWIGYLCVGWLVFNLLRGCEDKHK